MRYLHTLLFAIYPILFYFNNNKNEIYLSNIFTPLLYSLIFAGLFFICIYIFVKRKENVGVLTTTLLLLFFSYGHILNFADKSYRNLIIGLWTIIVIFVFTLSKKKSFEKVNPALNFISIFLIVFLLFDILKNPKLIKFADTSSVNSSLKTLKTVFKITPAKKNPPTKNATNKTTPQYKRLRKSSKYGKNFSMGVLNYSSFATNPIQLQG